MNVIKPNLELFSLLSSIYDIESNVFIYIRNKFQNFLLSINKLFSSNNWYVNNILKYINFLLSKKLFPFIISSILFIKSKISSVKFISEDFLNINIQNKNKLILFLLINSIETLLIKYVDTFFNYCYGFFYKSLNNNEKIKYYGKCTKHVMKNLRNIQNIFLGMNYYRMITPEENKNIFRGFDTPIKFFGYGFITKNIFNIYYNVKNIYKIYCLTEDKKELKTDEIKKNNLDENNFEEPNDDNENICLLCLNKYKNTCCTPCGHLFCWTCIHLYLTEKDICPKCKSKIKPQEILFLQNYYI